MSLHYTTSNGEESGRASHFHRDIKNAEQKCEEQNARAVELGVKVRYTVASTDREVEAKEIRD